MALDSLQRRNRIEPHSTGRRIDYLTERDLFWFEKLYRHGPLPSTYLVAYSRALGYTVDKKALDRLTLLFHEATTAHKAPYLDRPFQQHNTQLRYQPSVYDVRPAAKKALEEAGRLPEYAPTHAIGMWWYHDFMLACITASIELACLREPDKYRFIFHDEICGDISSHLSFPVTFTDITGKKRTQLLNPDRAFGIHYLKDNSVRYFLVEADRGTETVNSASAGRKRLLDTDLQYRQFIGKLDYKEAMLFDGGIVLLNVMTSEQRMHNLMGLIKPTNYMAFKALPIFGREFKSPPVMYDLFTDPWARPGKGNFWVNK